MKRSYGKILDLSRPVKQTPVALTDDEIAEDMELLEKHFEREWAENYD